MTPEYLEELAQRADPDDLWRQRGMDILNMEPEKRKQMDTAVALRRHAAHIRRLDALREQGKSLLITPLSLNGTAIKDVATPPDHVRLRNPAHGVSGTRAPDLTREDFDPRNALEEMIVHRYLSKVPLGVIEVRNILTALRTDGVMACPTADVTEAMKAAGVRELFLKDMQPTEEAWEEKVARIYIAMRNAGVTGTEGAKNG